MPEPGFRVGVSFHSFTDEYCSLKWSFDDMMELSSGLGRGVEIVGPAHHRFFPHMAADFVRSFRSAVERYDLVPVSYGSYADPFMRTDRDLTDDELVAYMLPQLRSAASLGFPIVRLQFFASRVVERLLPTAEKLDLKLGYELHAPLAFEADETKSLIDQVARLATPHLGIIPDCGIFGRSIPKFRIEEARARGIPDAIVQRGLQLWQQQADLGSALREVTEMGLKHEDIGAIETFWGSLGHSDPAQLITNMPHIIHVHGKFFTMENGDEPDLRYRDVVTALVKGGYRGWLSSEYEGPGGISSYEIVRQHQQMIHRYMQEALTSVE
jgi:sugar phosphate isomerase/epimerase